MTRDQIANEWNLDLNNPHTLLFACAEYWRRQAEYWKARTTEAERSAGPIDKEQAK